MERAPVGDRELRRGGDAGRIADAVRLAAVRACDLLGTGPEESFDRLTRMASTTLGVPLAFITVIDDRRSFWKSQVGADGAEGVGQQQPVTETLGALVVESGAPVVVPDVALDSRTRGNPLALALGIASWVGYPVHGPDRQIVGVLSVADVLPRAWSSRDLTVLEALSEITTGTIALRGALGRATDLARTLQQSLLPPTLPDLPGLDISARYRPAGDGAEVIGDFFDAFRTGPGSLGVVLGDVAGKGVEAARVTALAHYTIRAAASHRTDPAGVLRELNTALLTQRPDSERFLTAVYLSVRRFRRGLLRVTICSAGHTPVLLRGADYAVRPVGVHGLVLGVFGDAQLVNTEVRLRCGEMLLLYTDGVTEARRGDEQYGDDRLRGLVAALGPASAADLTAAVEADVLTFTAGPPQDDIAILALGLPHEPGIR